MNATALVGLFVLGGCIYGPTAGRSPRSRGETAPGQDAVAVLEPDAPVDECPDQMEDLDGVDDEDGCPDLEPRRPPTPLAPGALPPACAEAFRVACACTNADIRDTLCNAWRDAQAQFEQAAREAGVEQIRQACQMGLDALRQAGC